MAEKLTRQLVAEKAIVHAEIPIRAPHQVDRTFELPTGLYIAMAALFFGFVAVMATGFAAPGMVVPTGIIVVFIAAFFAVPTAMMRTRPETRRKALPWHRFQREGIVTHFGPASARDAAIQVLILPAMLFGWGLAVVTIAALV
ncbi:hypothetical protein [Tsuneonella sp. HG222]